MASVRTKEFPAALTVFGMKAETGRWLYVVLGMVMNLCLGTVYSWSVFKKPIETLFNCSALQSSMPFMIFLAAFAITMPIGGKLLPKLGPRVIGIAGGIMVGLGWILSGFAGSITSLYLTYGVVAGLGVGLVYGGPIAVSGNWFPDKRGLAVGLTVGGFGASALVTAPLARWLISTYGAMQTFVILGIAFLVVVVLLSIPLSFSPTGWKPAGWVGPKAGAASGSFTTSGMLKTRTFYGLWLCFLFGSTAGLMAIGIASPVGQEIVKLSAQTSAILVSVFAVFNGLGRPMSGWLTDRITARKTAMLSFVLIGLGSLGMLFAGEGSTGLYVACFIGFWLSLGGWLAIAPTSNATFFGAKHSASNYGILFSAYGIGAIIGSLVSGSVRDIFGSYTYAFIPTGIMAVVGLLLAVLMLKTPHREN